MSDYRLTITRVDGQPVRLLPGSRGERDLIEDTVTAALSKGVGVFRTEARVADAIRTALHEVIHGLKSEVLP